MKSVLFKDVLFMEAVALIKMINRVQMNKVEK
jgi:hypothetical protein